MDHSHLNPMPQFHPSNLMVLQYRNPICLFLLLLGGLVFGENTRSVLEIDISDSESLGRAIVEAANTSLNSEELLLITVRKGNYVLEQTFHIARSNVQIVAEQGAIFTLADNVNQPDVLQSIV